MQFKLDEKDIFVLPLKISSLKYSDETIDINKLIEYINTDECFLDRKEKNQIFIEDSPSKIGDISTASYVDLTKVIGIYIDCFIFNNELYIIFKYLKNKNICNDYLNSVKLSIKLSVKGTGKIIMKENNNIIYIVQHITSFVISY